MSRGSTISRAQMNRVLDALAARGILIVGAHLLPDKSVKFLAAGANENTIGVDEADLACELDIWAASHAQR